MDYNRFQDIRMISVAGAEESTALRRMADEAERYLTSFRWCPPIRRGWLVDGAGGIFALFLFEFTKPLATGDDQGRDRQLWVVVGDFPRACVPVWEDDTPALAVARYAGLLDRWIDRVMSFDPAGWHEYPLELEPSLHQARLLRLKVDFLRQEILPWLAG